MRGAWRILGIERGADRTAVRRAYARRLKVTNPEDDPAGFMALREAYEWLLEYVAVADHYEDAESEGRWDEPAERVDPGTYEPSEAKAGAARAMPGPWGSAASPEANGKAGEVDRLLGALDDALNRRGPDARGARIATLDALFASPALDRIDVSAQAERRLAEMIVDHVPVSDAIIVASVDRFGWADQKRANDWPFAEVMARLDEWQLISLLEKPDDPLHGAWRMLTGPNGGAKRGLRRWWFARSDGRGQVAELLSYADYSAPGIAHSFDPHAAAWWQEELRHDRSLIPPFLWRAAAGYALFALLWLWDVGIEVGAGVGAAAALAAIIDFAIMQRVLAREEPPSSPPRIGSAAIGVALALPTLLLLVPLTPVVAALTAAACFVIAWTVRLAWSEATGVDRTRRWATALGFGLLFFLFATLDRAVPLAQFGAWLAAAWLLLLQLPIVRPDSAEMIDRLTRDRTWPVLMAYAAGVAALAWFGPTIGQMPIVRAGFVLLACYAAGGIAAFAMRPLPPLMLWLTMVGSGIAMLVAAGSMDGQITFNGASPGEAIVAAHIETDPALIDAPEREAAAAMTRMRRRNPVLAARIDDMLARGTESRTEKGESMAAIDTLINRAVANLLPDSSNALIARHLRFRLLAMKDLRANHPQGCVADNLSINAQLSFETRAEARRVQLAITAHGAADPADRRDGALPDRANLDRIATLLRDAANPDKAAIAMCDAKIAGLTAMSALSDDQIATLTRAAHPARVKTEP